MFLECGHVGQLDTAGSPGHNRLEVLRSHDGAHTAATGSPGTGNPAGDDIGQANLVFTGRTDGRYVGHGIGFGNQQLFGFLGAFTPDVPGTAQFDLVVVDPKVDRATGLAFEK